MPWRCCPDSARLSSLPLLLRIDRQKDAIAEGGFEALDGAILVAPAGAAPDADGADHLTVHNDGNSARVGEESELHQLPRLSTRIVPQLGRADRSRLARLQRRLRLQHGRVDVGVDLSVASFLVDEGSVRVDDVDGGGAAVRRCPGAAGACDLLCCVTGNLIGIEDARRCASRYDEFRWQGRARIYILRQVETRNRRAAPIA